MRRTNLNQDDQIDTQDEGQDRQPADADPSSSSARMNHTIFDTPIVSSLARIASLVFLRVIGWRPGGSTPEPPKYVLIAAPHTSNFDFLLLMAFAFRFRVKLHWMGKDSLFLGIRGPFARYLGGIAIDRSKSSGVVEQTIQTFRKNDRLAITVPVAGTRGKRDRWKSGFYHIARGAEVPVVLGFLDYSRKVGGFGPALMLTGDITADMAIIAEFYADIGARYPEMKSVPSLEPRPPEE